MLHYNNFLFLQKASCDNETTCDDMHILLIK
jgi:hypothetical protein